MTKTSASASTPSDRADCQRQGTLGLRVGTGSGEIATLEQARAALARRRPSLRAPLAVWEQYHLDAAHVYRDVAEIDRAHYHEARGYYAVLERRYAEYIALHGRYPDGYPDMPGW